MAGDGMFGWHHRLDGHESEQALETGDVQGSWLQSMGHKELDKTQRLNNNNMQGALMDKVDGMQEEMGRVSREMGKF